MSNQSWAKPELRKELDHLLNTEERDLKPLLSTFDTAHLIALLSEERGKFTSSCKSMMELFIQELVDRKVYPTEWNGKPINVYRRVEGWGARWHEWDGLLVCPAGCGADLRDTVNGPPFKREIAIYDRGRDRTVAYQCPDCKKEWSR